MPRYFDPSEEGDQVIYEEESEVPEMYFTQEGKVGVGYSVMPNGLHGRPYKLARFFKGSFILCDYYVLNTKRSEFIYMVLRPVKCFALSAKFWKKQLFPKYPELTNQLKVDSLLRYNKLLKQPLVRNMKIDNEIRNRKRVYRQYFFEDKEDTQWRSKTNIV